MNEKELLTKDEYENYRRIKEYNYLLSELELKKFESNIFGDITENEKIEIEYKRTKRLLSNNPKLYSKLFTKICYVTELYKMVNFDKSLNEKVKKEILDIQLICEIPICFYSMLPKLEKDYDYLIFTRKK